MTKIKVTEVKKHEDGSATYTFDLNPAAEKVMVELGIKLLLYCTAAGVTTGEALSSILGESVE